MYAYLVMKLACSYIMILSSLFVSAQTKYLPVLNDPVDDAATLISDAAWALDLSAHFGMEEVDGQVVRITSNQPLASGGYYTMDVALFTNAAPASRANFLAYLNDSDYPGTFIDLHSLTGKVLRAGNFEVQTTPTSLDITRVESDPFVSADGSVSHTYGTVGMQKATGTNDIGNPFFFNLDANSDNLDGSGNQTGVIGRVTLSSVETLNSFGDTLEYPVWNLGSAFSSIPVRGDYDGENAVLETDLIVLDDFSMEPIPVGDYNTTTALSYSVSATGTEAGDNSSLISSAVVSGDHLDIVFAAGEIGTSTVTVRATDSIGTIIEDSFIITRSAEDYETWRALYWTGADFSDDSTSGPLADPDGDGVTNLQLYAQGFGANDHPDHTPTVLAGNGTNGAISFRLSKTADVTVLLQRSDDLGQADVWSSTAFTEQSRVDMGDYYQVTIQPNAALQSKDFYRMAFQLN